MILRLKVDLEERVLMVLFILMHCNIRRLENVSVPHMCLRNNGRGKFENCILTVV